MIECPVSKSLLLAAGQLRNRWSSNGFIEQFRITELGLDQDIVEALRHQSDVDNLISYYQDVGLVKECQDKKSGEIDVVSIVNSTTKVPTATPVQWNRIMVLACFFFTGCCEYESGYVVLCRFKVIMFDKQSEYETNPYGHCHCFASL
jgi:hypothetical protein